METVILDVRKSGEEAIEQAAQLLRRGEIVAFPTETVYGLGAVVWNEEAVRKIFVAKGRPLDNPLIVHIASIQMALPLVREPLDRFQLLARHFWPGPLTLVVEHRGNVPSIVTAGLQTVAIRMPDHPVALALIEKVGEPLVAPSANRSGKPSPTRAEHVVEDLAGSIAAVLDAGPTQVGIESTVLVLTTEPPRIVRPGVVTKEVLETVLGVPIEEVRSDDVNRPVAPGMKYRHYAPTVPVQLFENPEELDQALQGAPERRILILALPQWRTRFQHYPGYRLLSEKTLYETFREADRDRWEAVWILADKEVQRRRGLYNRILKAATS